MKAVLRQVLSFSLFALIIIASFSSFTSLLNHIHKQHGLGHYWHSQIFFAVNTVSAIFFNIIIPNLQISDLKKLIDLVPVFFLMIYIFTYIGFMTDNNTITLVFTGLAGICAGIANATIAIVSGKYLFVLCEINDAKQDEGKYFGIYGSIMSSNFFLGAIFSAVALTYLPQKHDLNIILAILTVIGFFYCKFFIKNPERPNQMILDSNTSRQTNKEQQDNITLIDEKKRENARWIQLKIKIDKNCLSENLSVYKKMASLIPFQTLNGLTVGYVMHCLEDLIFPPENSSKDTFLTISLMLVGAGGAFGAYSAGYLSDRLSSKKVFYVGVGVCLASFILGMIVLNSENELLSLFASILSGFGMMYTNSMLVVMCSKYYEGSMMVFGTNRQIINLAFLIYSLTINVISPQNMHSQMYYELAILIFIALGCLYMVRFIRYQKCQKQGELPNETKMEELNQVDDKIEKVVEQKDGI